jgi:hypothetical protein
VLQIEVHRISKCVPRDFASFVGYGVYLLQIYTCYCQLINKMTWCHVKA